MTRLPGLRILLPAALVVLAFVLGFVLRGGGEGTAGSTATVAGAAAESAPAAPTIWTCSMHPQIRLPQAGQCPICFMDLIPLEQGAGQDEGPRVLVMTEAAMALAEVQTAPVVRRRVDAEVRLIGTVAADETRTRTITARVAGRLDTLFVDYTGAAVRQGQPLVSLYSPALFAAQTELLGALGAGRSVEQSSSALVRETSAATIEAARRRLGLWGLDADQIAAIERDGRASDHLRIRSPLGGVVLHKAAVEGMYVKEGMALYTVADLATVWIELEAYESDLTWLRVGQEVAVAAPALPGRRLTGRVVFIDPVLSARKRTAGVRLEVANADGSLKPGMYVDAVVAAPAAGGGDPLVIPATAPLITGKRAVVYVRLVDRERPTFEGRVIELGPRAGDWYVVGAGLAEGEQVVVNGNFKIDSALQIQAKPSMMSAEPAAAAVPAPAAGGRLMPVPAAFLADLDRVLTAYLRVQGALAGDDDAAAATAAADLQARLAAVSAEGLAGRARTDWTTQAKALGTAVGAVVGAGDIAGRRHAFEDVSDGLWRTLAGFGTVRDGPVRLFHCPMAHDNQGADWLQLAVETANPYFGAAMLRCGSQTDSLTAVGQGR